MARVKVFDEEKALDAAMKAFWKSGYKATSIQDLERVMGLKRTSIYNAYGDKRQLFRLALERYLSSQEYLTAMQEQKEVRAAITALFDVTIKLHFDQENPGGCLMVLSLMEGEHHDKETRTFLEKAHQGLRDAIVMRLRQGVAEGELPADTDCLLVGNQMIATLAGVLVMARANIAKRELKALVKGTVAALLP